MTRSYRKGSRGWRAAWLALLLVCAGQAVSQLAASRSRILLDFASFYYGARIAAQGGNIYDVENLNALAAEDRILKADRGLFPYLYPPVLAVMLRGMTVLSRPVAETVWIWFNVAMFVLAGMTAIRFASFEPEGTASDELSRRRVCVIATVALLIVLPVRNNIRLGQINPLVLLAMTLFLDSFFRNRRSMLSGAWLSLAAAIKVTPAALALLFIRQRTVRPFAGLALGGLVLVAFTVAAGSAAQWAWFIQSLPAHAYGETIPGLMAPNHVWNLSLAGFFARIFEESPVAVRIWTTMTVAVLYGVVAVGLLIAQDERAEKLLLLPLSVAMIVSAPYAWGHHVVFLLPGLLYATVHVWFRFAGPWRYALIAVLNVLAFVGGINLERLYRLVPETCIWGRAFFTSLSLYALLGLYGAGLGLFRNHARASTAAPRGDSAPQ